MPDHQRRLPKIGLAICPVEGCMDGETARWTDILAMAQMAEDVGFDSIWLSDHLIFRLEESPIGVWECGSMLAALASSTKRVELGTAVICTGFRNPALLAKMADTIDEISGGRLVLGIGAGWHDPEYRAFGYPTDRRYSRFEEAVRIIHGLLRNGSVDFEGAYYRARECELRPRGPRPEGPPIMIGTTGQKMLRLTTRYADLWNAASFEKPPGQSRPEGLEAEMAILDGACNDLGRDPSTLLRTALVTWQPQNQAPAPWAGSKLFGQPLNGSPEEVAEVFRDFARAGFSHLQVCILPNSPAAVEAFAPVLAALDRAE